MSRAAYAVADYLPELDEAGRDARDSTGAFRLMGEARRNRSTTGSYRQRTLSAMKAQEPRGQLKLVPEANIAPYREAPLQSATGKQPASWRWALAIGVSVAIAIAMLTPLLAAQGNRLLRISGYAAMAEGVSGTEAAVPVIDSSKSASQAGEQPQAAQPSLAPADSYILMAAPSISVGQIERVLTQYGSPAVGLGQTIYDLGVKYGIDPAYALAFFVHESGCGTRGVARFTKSIGNIRWTEGYDNYEGYRSYSSWASGVEDWYKLIKELYIDGWQLKTVDAIVPVYAPYGDNNDPPGYAAAVKSMVASWRGK